MPRKNSHSTDQQGSTGRGKDDKDNPPETNDSRQTPPTSTTNLGGETDRGTEQTRYLIGLEYEDRAERRRVEYRLENWEGTVSQTPRLTRIVEGEDFYELFDALQETVDNPEHLSVYELNDLTPSNEERTVRIDRVYDVELDKLEWAVDSLLNKRTVTQKDATTYQIHPDSSTAKVTLEYDLMNVQHGVRLELTLTGPTPAPNAVKDAMLRDLGYLLPEPKEAFDR